MLLCLASCKKDEQPAHTHEFGEWTTTTLPTCTEDGEQLRFCSCGEDETRAIMPLGHSWTESTCTTPQICTTCNTVGEAAKGHVLSDWSIVTPASCIAAGEKTRSCSNCTFSEDATIDSDPNAHSVIVREAVPQTCTTTGLTEGSYCSLCQSELTAQETLPALGHTIETMQGYDSTCTAVGLTNGEQCSVCKLILTAQNKIPLKSHEFDDEYDATCNNCTLVRNPQCRHSNTEVIKGYAAGCTTVGYEDGTRCSDCQEILVPSKLIEALGHTEETIPAVEATCYSTGLTAGVKCTVCKDILTSQQTIGKIGHTPGAAATCTTAQKCSVCSTTLVEAYGHTSSDWITDSNATCTLNGSKHKECTVCHISLATESIPAKHTLTTIAAQSPTCTEVGWYDHVVCSRCDYTTYVERAALGHSLTEGVCIRCISTTISGYEDLLNIKPDGNYILSANVDLGGAEWTPIGTVEEPFSGSFDGNGYVISNFKITSSLSYAGFFGYSSGDIKNLGLENFTIDVDISSYNSASDVSIVAKSYAYAGGLVAYNDGGDITNCYATGDVSIYSYTYASSTASNNSTSSYSYTYCGGLIGVNDGGSVKNCYATGNVSPLANAYATSSYPTNHGYAYSYGGGLIALNIGDTTNCYAMGEVNTVYGYSYSAFISNIGGLIGKNEGNISDCYAIGYVYSSKNDSNVSAESAYCYIGGLVGVNDGVISGSHASGNTNAVSISANLSKNGIGGLVGDNRGEVSRCYASGSISTRATTSQTSAKGYCYAGGLIGHNSGKTVNSYATGEVISYTNSTYGSGYGYIGGLVGYNENGLIANCYATGNVTSGFLYNKSGYFNYAGGLVGYNQGLTSFISSCFAIGDVSALNSSSASAYAGGIVGGDDSGNIFKCYCSDGQTFTVTQNGSDVSTATNSFGKKVSASNLQSKTWINENLWIMEIIIWSFDGGYPTLSDDVAINTAIQISTAEELLKLQGESLTLNYVLTQNIDLGGAEWNPIVLLTGSFDGGGCRISNFKITAGSTHVGFFKVNAGSIENLALENFTISVSSTQTCYIGALSAYNAGEKSSINNCSGDGNINIYYTGGEIHLGGLIGYNYKGQVSNSHFDGIITASCSAGTLYAGGLIGYSYDGNIQDSHTTCSISSTASTYASYARIGGLIGYLDVYYGKTAFVSNCYATGDVTSSSANGYVGGLIGDNSKGVILYCYATGNVTSDTNCSDSSCYVGGLIANNTSGEVSNCYATGNITAKYSLCDTNYAGGLIGNSSNSKITNCYAIGNVSMKTPSLAEKSYIGGLVGYFAGELINCYATGNVSERYNVTYNYTKSYAGGLIAYLGGGTTNCYRSSSQSVSCGSKGTIKNTTTMDLKTINSIAFHTDTLGWSSDIWSFVEGDHPTLKITSIE